MTNADTSLPGPVAVGGVGGSGTRVVASLMQALGFYIGGDLNKSLDNLWFTLLFKRPRWYLNLDGEAREKQVSQGLRIFEKAMTRGLRSHAEPWEAGFIKCAGDEISSRTRSTGARHTNVQSILSSTAPRDQRYTCWGWKEPNTHLFLTHLCSYFPEMKYIHVIRNGLDMAFSSNRQQLTNWGHMHGIACPDSPEKLPRVALHYWVVANRNAVANARRLLADRCHIILFDELCAEPGRHIRDLARFLGHAPGADGFAGLKALVQPPPTIGRFRQHDLSALDPADVAAVADFGFDVS